MRDRTDNVIVITGERGDRPDRKAIYAASFRIGGQTRSVDTNRRFITGRLLPDKYPRGSSRNWYPDA